MKDALPLLKTAQNVTVLALDPRDQQLHIGLQGRKVRHGLIVVSAVHRDIEEQAFAEVDLRPVGLNVQRDFSVTGNGRKNEDSNPGGATPAAQQEGIIEMDAKHDYWKNYRKEHDFSQFLG